MNFMNITIYLKSRNTKFSFESIILLYQFYFYRMLEKDPNQRFDINQVDVEVKRINFKKENVLEGKLFK